MTEGVVAVEKQMESPAGGAAPQAGPAPVRDTAKTVSASNRLVVELAPQVAFPTAPVAITAPEMSERLAWRAARLEFTDTPLATAAELFNRYSEQGEIARLVVDSTDRALARMEVSGYFRADNVEAFIILVEQTLGLKAERQEGRILLRRSP